MSEYGDIILADTITKLGPGAAGAVAGMTVTAFIATPETFFA